MTQAVLHTSLVYSMVRLSISGTEAVWGCSHITDDNAGHCHSTPIAAST